MEKKVEVKPELEDVFNYFTVLHFQRSQGFDGVEALKVSDVVMYLDAHQLTGYRKQRTLELILAVDRAFVDYHTTKKRKVKG